MCMMCQTFYPANEIHESYHVCAPATMTTPNEIEYWNPTGFLKGVRWGIKMNNPGSYWCGPWHSNVSDYEVLKKICINQDWIKKARAIPRLWNGVPKSRAWDPPSPPPFVPPPRVEPSSLSVPQSPLWMRMWDFVWRHCVSVYVEEVYIY
jgi:hypothetical protein